MDSYDLHIEDEQGRTLLIINDNGEVAVSRFPDMSKEIMDAVVELYTDATGESEESIRNFLNYSSDENAFCS